MDMSMGWAFYLDEESASAMGRELWDIRGLADAIIVIVYTVAGVQFRMLKDWIKDERIRKELENERLKAELRFLKAQISPHFLFNTLNSLYALASNRSEQTAPAIMQLSEIMRYMLYECNVEKIALAKEVEYLKGLIELQKLRLKENIVVTFEVEGNLKGKYISPLLLVIAVENSFKHGITYNQGMEINFKLLATSESIRFIAQNPLLPKGKSHDEVGGIGLANLQKRLELLYPDQYKLNINTENQQFTVDLTLNHG